MPRQVVALKIAGTVLFGVLAAIGDHHQLFLAGVVALGLAVVAIRDLLVPVRLSASADGLVVAGLAGRERVSWNDVDRIRVDSRRRYGLTTELLEIEAGDQVYLFSRFDLGASVFDVADELMRLRP